MVWIIVVSTLPCIALAEKPPPIDNPGAEESRPFDEDAQQVDLKPVDETDPWREFVPPEDEFDWIQTTSGEWLKGKLRVYYGQEFEFDSDEFGILQIAKDDVRQLRCHKTMSIRLNGPFTLKGKLQLTANQIIITRDETQRVFDRSDLISITQDAFSEIHNWTAKISLGLNLSSGNTEQVNYSATADIRRNTLANRFVLTYLGQFSSSEDIATVDNHRIKVFDDISKTRQLYFRPVFAEYYSDAFKNINVQYSIGAGVGYQLIDKSQTEWAVTAGLAYQETRFDSVEAGENQTVSTPALVVSTSYETGLTKRIDFTGDFSFKLLNEASGQYTHHAVATFETKLTSWLDLDISLVWDHIQKPTANADGTLPKPDDYKLMFTLGVEY